MRRRLFLALIVVALAAAGCSTGGGDGYQVTARFTRAVALYEQSDVTVMGIEIGHVEEIAFDRGEVVITMRIRGDVPLPADVTAAIAPVSLIGERHIVLTPWKPGDLRLEDGAVITSDRTLIPVEPDEALQAITDLVQALDPDAVNDLLVAAAGALDGNGAAINRALIEIGALLPQLAAQDDELVALAGDIQRIGAVLRAREAQIGRLLQDFSTVAGVLSEEREAVIDFVEALASLSREGKALLTAYEVSIPEGLAELATLSLSIQVAADQVDMIVPALLALNIELIDGVDGTYNAVHGRGVVPRTIADQLVPIFELFGVAMPCVPAGGSVCP